MKLTTNLFGNLAICLVLACAASPLSAQNTLSVTPGNVFLNATQNGGLVQTSVAVTSAPAPAVVTAAASSAPWLTFSNNGTSTPTSIAFIGNPTGLNPGVYNTVTSISGPGTTAVPVLTVLTVNAVSPLAASPLNLVFNYTAGGALPVAQQISINSSSTLAYTASGNANWLQFAGTTGQAGPGAPGVVTVGINPASLTPGSAYVAAVTITPTNGLPAVIVPIALYYFQSPQLTAAPTSLTFNYQIGGTNNILQKSINLTGGGAAINYSATASVTTSSGGQQWLAVAAPTSGATPGTVTATITPGALPAGQYQGTITISAPASSTPTLAVPVTLNVSTAPLLDLSSNSLAFSYQTGGALPAHQTLTPNATSAGVNYTLAVTTNNNTGNWLIASGNGITPNPIDVSVNPVGLPAGTYTGAITLNAINGGNNPQVVNVTLTVSASSTITTTPPAATGLVFNYEVNGTNNTGPQTVSVAAGAGGAIGFSIAVNQVTTSNGINWLLGPGQTSQTTPANFSISVSPAGMAPGSYTGNVTLTPTGSSSPVVLPVTLNVSPAGTALISASPASLTFAFTAQSGSAPPPQIVTVNSTGESVTYTATAAVASPPGATWLSVGAPNGPSSAASPSTFFVGIVPGLLTTGSYTGTITIQPSNGSPAVTVPVTLNVSVGNLTVAPASLSFTVPAGAAAPAPQTINLASSGGALSFTAFASGASWLSVSPASGITPTPLSVSVNPAGLQAGSYTGTINIVSAGAGNSPQTVTVNLTVTTAQTLILSTGSLTFTSQVGAAPAPQIFAMATSSGNLPFTAAASVTSPAGGTWLSISPANGTASGTNTILTATVNPQGLNPGTYTGVITITSPNASNSPQTVPVTYVVAAIPTPAPTTVVNAGSFQPGAVAPGEIVTIGGTNLGPATGVVGTVSNNVLANSVSDTQVSFDNIPAPLLYVSATQINAVVPYGIAGRAQTRMVVTYKGTAAAAIVLNVAAAAPGVFPNTAPGFPATQGAILNANGSLNGPSSPAAKGTPIVIYATGEGQTTPPGVDGVIIPAVVSALKMPVLPVRVTIGGQNAEVQYAGSAPGFVSGALQINVVVPDGAASGNTVPVVVNIGGVNSSGVTTVAVQ